MGACVTLCSVNVQNDIKYKQKATPETIKQQLQIIEKELNADNLASQEGQYESKYKKKSTKNKSRFDNKDPNYLNTNVKQKVDLEESKTKIICLNQLKEIDNTVNREGKQKGDQLLNKISNAHIQRKSIDDFSKNAIKFNCYLEIVTKLKHQQQHSIISNSDNTIVKISQKIEFTNGAIYQGEWKNGKLEGFGRMEWLNGFKYQGYWHQNQVEGNGKLIYPNGQQYEGQFKQNEAEGYGKFYFSDKSIYIGNWKHNKKQGQGMIILPNQQKYTGNWHQDEKNGYGQLYFSDGSYYKGNFKKNAFNGQGQYLWKNKYVYEGNWECNAKNGAGILTWNNGRRYEGQFLNDKMHGKGKMIEVNGIQYTGNWQNNKKQGKFIYMNSKGEMKIAQFYCNKLLKHYLSKSFVKKRVGTLTLSNVSNCN